MVATPKNINKTKGGVAAKRIFILVGRFENFIFSSEFLILFCEWPASTKMGARGAHPRLLEDMVIRRCRQALSNVGLARSRGWPVRAVARPAPRG
ncbi:hypothetical protein [Roseospira visakhapatnamensis]|uniref:Uncharacterized protein n=1 Tax=Roseospira visakhapatnamensis TaxID=390880 RepID=A0A7W6RF65_9PROT|nr:hypothetical protein [Roseospira visakhapatnamensis]MBB4267240.1 hypothetical protein [Roseospira visakhapatnamensis]